MTIRTLRAPLAALALVLATPGVSFAWTGNQVRVVQEGDGHAATITQNGDDNYAAMRQAGRNQTGAIVQNGDDNEACLIQRGRSGSTAIVQNGGESLALVQRPHRDREVSLSRCASYVNGDISFGHVMRRR